MQGGLLAVLLVLHFGLPLEAACPSNSQMNRTSSLGVLSWEQLGALLTCVNVSGINIFEIRGSPRWKSPLKELDLSHNRLSHLPTGFLNHTEGLERLFLHSNALPELPPTFFEKTRHLKELRLEGNLLTSVPISLLHFCLETLSVDCHCGVAGSVFSYCQRLNCTQNCHCSSPQGFLNLTEFYAQQCQGLSRAVYATIAASVLAVLLGATVAYVLIRRKKQATSVREKQESSTSNGTQPRYISHTSLQVDPTHYENVFIGQSQVSGGGHKERYSRKQPKSRLHRKVQEAEPPSGEQPIYANTQEVYSNYVGTPAPLDEDLYVMPDH